MKQPPNSAESYARDSWEGAIRAWRIKGDSWPVAYLLRQTTDPVPEFARVFLADVFDGTEKKRRGRPALSATMKGTLQAAARDPKQHAILRQLGIEPEWLLPGDIRSVQQDYEAALKHAQDKRAPGRGETPSVVAAERVAEAHGLTSARALYKKIAPLGKARRKPR